MSTNRQVPLLARRPQARRCASVELQAFIDDDGSVCLACVLMVGFVRVRVQAGSDGEMSAL
ncbi:hypothetical protein GCM10028833_18120 [Glycomyces tarimensis]